MIQLPNGCRCSTPSVFPKNYLSGGPKLLQLEWRIAYYFRDPLHQDKYPKGKYIIIKGMNQFKTLAERRDAVKLLMAQELDLLQEQGWNPITKTFAPTATFYDDISAFTPLVEALEFAKEKLTVSEQCRRDLKSVIKHTKLAATRLRLNHLAIGQLRRRHVKLILDEMPKVKKVWSANQFNYYRAHLSMLFAELVEYEAMELNPVAGIKKKKHTQGLRTMLTMEERKAIDVHLKASHYAFWRYMHIFFHSGCRKTELHALQPAHVDLARQRFKVMVKKGANYVEQYRPIKNIVLPLWQELMAEAEGKAYLFSRGVLPGNTPLVTDRISKLWLTMVKGKKEKGGLDIQVDFYSLKHLNLDETAAALDVRAAQMMAGHTTPVVTLKHYALGEEERQLERLKDVSNGFV